MPNVFTNPHRNQLYRANRIRKQLKKPQYDEELPDYLSRHAIDSDRGLAMAGVWYWHPRFALARANEHATVSVLKWTSEAVRVRLHHRYFLAGLRSGVDNSLRPELVTYQRECARLEAEQAAIRCRKSKLQLRDKDFRERKQEIERDELRVQEARQELGRDLRLALGKSSGVGEASRKEELVQREDLEALAYAELCWLPPLDLAATPVI